MGSKVRWGVPVLGAMLLLVSGCGDDPQDSGENGLTVNGESAESSDGEQSVAESGATTATSSDNASTAPATSTDDDRTGTTASSDESEPGVSLTTVVTTPKPDGPQDTVSLPESNVNSTAKSDEGAEGGSDGSQVVAGSGPIDAGLTTLVDTAAGRLADSLGVSKGQITVQSARLATWSDASAGCPQSGMRYAQVITDGAAIELIAGGKTYWFHSGGSRGPFLCTSPQRQRA